MDKLSGAALCERRGSDPVERDRHGDGDRHEYCNGGARLHERSSGAQAASSHALVSPSTRGPMIRSTWA